MPFAQSIEDFGILLELFASLSSDSAYRFDRLKARLRRSVSHFNDRSHTQAGVPGPVRIADAGAIAHASHFRSLGIEQRQVGAGGNGQRVIYVFQWVGA